MIALVAAAAWTTFLAGQAHSQQQRMLTGRVEGEAAEVPPESEVRARPLDTDKQQAECDNGGVKCASVNSNGRYEINALRSRAYEVAACPSPRLRPFKYLPAAKVVDLRGGETVQTVDFELQDASGSVTVPLPASVAGPYCVDTRRGTVKEGDCLVVRVYDADTGCFLGYRRSDRQSRISLPKDRRYRLMSSYGHNVDTKERAARYGLDIDPKTCQDGAIPAQIDDDHRCP